MSANLIKPLARRTAVYDALRQARWESTGHGYERKPWTGFKELNFAEEERFYVDQFRNYINAKIDRLAGMIAVVAIIEGRTEDEIREKVWNS